MTSEPRLRPATPADADASAAILQDWLDETPWMPRLHTLADTRAFMRERLFPACAVTVAEVDGATRGYLALRPGGVVQSITVGRGWRGRGLGVRLMAAARAASPGGLTLWTFVANEGARRFYGREGFVEVERTEGDNDEGLPDVKLVWRG